MTLCGSLTDRCISMHPSLDIQHTFLCMTNNTYGTVLDCVHVNTTIFLCYFVKHHRCVNIQIQYVYYSCTVIKSVIHWMTFRNSGSVQYLMSKNNLIHAMSCICHMLCSGVTKSLICFCFIMFIIFLAANNTCMMKCKFMKSMRFL